MEVKSFECGRRAEKAFDFSGLNQERMAHNSLMTKLQAG
jgi:hypothetical protein